MPRKHTDSGEPANGGGKRGSGFTAAVGFVPLALALLVGNAVLPSAKKTEIVNAPNAAKPAVCEDDVADFEACHTEYPTGCTEKGQYDAYLNLLKNTTKPSLAGGKVKYLMPSDFEELERNTPPELSKKNHQTLGPQLSRLGEGYVHGVVAYLYYAQSQGAESTNCKLTGPDDVDYHIGLGFDPQLAEVAAKKRLTPAEKSRLRQNSIVVEMTPHYRAAFQPNWSVDELKAVLGQKVRVEGQLLIDSEHFVRSQDCGMANADAQKCWRASAWELHPVTKFQVCNGTKCDQTSSDWAELGAPELEATTVAASRDGGASRRRTSSGGRTNPN